MRENLHNLTIYYYVTDILPELRVLVVRSIVVSETDKEDLQFGHRTAPDESIINQPPLYQSIEALLGAQRLSDTYTYVHQVRVSKIAEKLSRDLGLSDFEVEGIRVAGLLHDIGKIALPAQILNKVGDLSQEEFALIKTHPCKGEEILNFLEFPWPVQKIVLQHHERLNGSGYPDGITGSEQLFGTQIIAVADVTEAVMTSRPYREKLGLEELYGVLNDEAGALFNADIVLTLTNLFNTENEVLLECLDDVAIFRNVGTEPERLATG